MLIHKEGYGSVLMTFITLVVICGILLLSFGANIFTLGASILLFCLFCFIAYFFRNPVRAVNFSRGALLSAADGKVAIIKEVTEDEYLHAKVLQVSVFMGIFNVHVNYFPIAGRILFCKHHYGKYVVAWHPKSSTKNERTTIAMETDGGEKILIRQIAGYVARRVVCYAKEGERVAQGDQLGFIKFGSRVDFFLPLGSEILVKKGDKVTACRTVIARLK